MDNSILASRISRLANASEALAETIRAETTPDGEASERMQCRARSLRENLGAALVHSERLARQMGNEKMVTFQERPDGTSEATFVVNLARRDLT